MEDSYVNDFITKSYEAAGQSNFVEAMNFILHNVSRQSEEYQKYFRDALSRLTCRNWLIEYMRVLRVSVEEVEGGLIHFDGSVSFDGSRHFDEKGTTLTQVTIPEGFIPTAVVDDLYNPAVFLLKDKDFTVSGNCLYAHANKTLPLKKTVAGGEIVYTMGCLNGIQLYNRGINLYANLVDLPNSTDKDLVNITWDLIVEGCSEKNVRRLCCYMGNSSLPTEDGVVRSIRKEAGCPTMILTDHHVLTAPEGSESLQGVGDKINGYDLVFDSVAIDYEGSVCYIRIKEDCLSETLSEEHFSEILERLGASQNKYELQIVEG
jgi:hypothetical protein